jgi:hypothetical protein
MNEFNIIEYLSGLTGYVFDKAVLERIAYDRDVYDVTDYEELDTKKKDLLKADLLYTAYFSPNIIASSTQSHGSYTKTIGSQTVYAKEKERLYNMFYHIYSKYEDDKLEEIKTNEATLQWLDF